MTKINWYNGKTANSASDMQKLCDTVNRSLLTPVSAPADTKIVAVDNTNSQKMLTIGDGLSVENDTLKTSGGSGEKLYSHNIKFTKHNTNTFNVVTNVMTKNSTLFTSQSFYDYLEDNKIEFPIVGLNGISNTSFAMLNKVRAQGNINAYSFDGNTVSLSDGIFSYGSSSLGVSINEINLVDTVIEL